MYGESRFRSLSGKKPLAIGFLTCWRKASSPTRSITPRAESITASAPDSEPGSARANPRSESTRSGALAASSRPSARSILMVPFWHERFPAMRFLHVIRDGRDMAYSEQQNQIRRHGNAILGSDIDRPWPERAMLWWARVNGALADYGEGGIECPLPTRAARRPLRGPKEDGKKTVRIRWIR